MRALDGGQVGVIDLGQLDWTAGVSVHQTDDGAALRGVWAGHDQIFSTPTHTSVALTRISESQQLAKEESRRRSDVAEIWNRGKSAY